MKKKKDNRMILTVIIVFVAVVAISLIAIFMSYNKNATKSIAGKAIGDCSDTDSTAIPSINYNTKGTAINRITNSQFTDRCDGDKLIEAYCTDTGAPATSLPYSCPNGCYDSACVASPCSDTGDAGKDYYTKGTNSWVDTKQDTCLDKPLGHGVPSDKGPVLREYWCQGNIRRSEEKLCDYGCKNGACTQGTYVMDSDGGASYDYPGSLSSSTIPQPDYFARDYCVNDKIVEYYSMGTTWFVDAAGTCATGKICYDGACMTQTNACSGKCGVISNKGVGPNTKITCPACIVTGQICYNEKCCLPKTASQVCTGKCGTVSDDCGGTVTCPTACSKPACNDGIDNDQDGKCDYAGCTINGDFLPADQDCKGVSTGTTESCTPVCAAKAPCVSDNGCNGYCYNNCIHPTCLASQVRCPNGDCCALPIGNGISATKYCTNDIYASQTCGSCNNDPTSGYYNANCCAGIPAGQTKCTSGVCCTGQI